MDEGLGTTARPADRQDVVGLVHEKQARLAGTQGAPGEAERGEPALAVELGVVRAGLADGVDRHPGLVGQDPGEGGLAGARLAVQQEVDAGLGRGGRGPHQRVVGAQMGDVVPVRSHWAAWRNVSAWPA